MTEAEWLACADTAKMFRTLGPEPNQRKCGLFAAACCRTVFDWLVDARSREAVEVVEAFADGEKTEADMHRAHARASRAAGIGMGPPARAVSWATIDPDSYCCSHVIDEVALAFGSLGSAEQIESRTHQAVLLRDVFGNPFRPITFDPAWRTDTAVALARGMYVSREFSAMPILADALQDAGCNNEHVLAHCRDAAQVHVRGCWVVDLVLGRG